MLVDRIHESVWAVVSEKPGFRTNTRFLNGTKGKQANEGNSLSCGIHESHHSKCRRPADRRNRLQPRCTHPLFPLFPSVFLND